MSESFDEDGADWMQKHQMSTSPAVVFRPLLKSSDTNQKIDLDDGSTARMEASRRVPDGLDVGLIDFERGGAVRLCRPARL